MRSSFVAVFVAALALAWAPAEAQQAKAVEPARAAPVFDAAAIRRQAAQLAEFRTLLADPDPTVRLLTLREAIRAGDATQRQMAIEMGLASNESEMLELALRGMMANIHQIIMEFVDAEGKLTTAGNTASLRLTVTQFDMETGQIQGTSACNGTPKWSGQLQGVMLVFNADTNMCSGSLTWVSDPGDFRGRVNLYSGQTEGNRNAIWKPR